MNRTVRSVITFSIFLCPLLTTAQDFWQRTNGPYGGTINSLAINSSGHIFAATNANGIFRSCDNGDSWTPINTGLTNLYFYSLAINSKGYLFAGTDGGEIFRSMESSVGVLENANHIHHSFILEQNYPNPFNPETTIRYQLFRRAYVTIHIFDLQGRVIQSLTTGQKEAGYHTTVWDGKDEQGKTVASGTYLYRMEAQSGRDCFVKVKKMVLFH